MADIQLAARVADVVNMLHATQATITALQADMRRQFDSLRDHVDRRFATLTASNNQSSQRLNTIQQDLSNARDTIGELVTANNLSNRRLSTIEQDLRTANTGLVTANNTLRQLKTTSDDSNQRLIDLQRDLTAANTELIVTNTNLGQLNNANDETSQRLDTLQHDLADATRESDRRFATILLNLTSANDQQGLIRGRADTIVTDMRDLRTELRAGHFNSAARIINANASRCCNMAISAFHGVDNQVIPNFPATLAHLEHLNSTSLDQILGRLRVNSPDTVTKKRIRLKKYLGIRFS